MDNVGGWNPFEPSRVIGTQLNAPNGSVQVSPKRQSPRLPAIDGLRGIAILAVILGHYFVQGYSSELQALSPILLNVGMKFQWGVDLFFVVSGFLIGGIFLDYRMSPSFLKVFCTRRILRILPLYYFLVIFVMGSFYFLGFPGKERYVPFWAYLLFLQNFWTSAGFWALFAFGPLWSIAVEEQFYLSAILFRRAPLKKVKWIIFICVALALGTRLLCIGGFLNVEISHFTPCRLDALAIGIIGALLVRRKGIHSNPARAQLRVGILFIAVGILGYAVLQALSPFFQMLFSLDCIALCFVGVIVLAATLQKGWFIGFLSCRFLTVPGKYCYFLYLFHFTILDNIGLLVKDKLLVRLLALAISFIAAAISWRYLESPLIKLGKRWDYVNVDPEIRARGISRLTKGSVPNGTKIGMLRTVRPT